MRRGAITAGNRFSTISCQVVAASPVPVVPAASVYWKPMPQALPSTRITSAAAAALCINQRGQVLVAERKFGRLGSGLEAASLVLRRPARPGRRSLARRRLDPHFGGRRYHRAGGHGLGLRRRRVAPIAGAA